MISAVGANNATLTYDPIGRLSRITSSTTDTTFVYDGVFLIAEYYTSSNYMAKRYIHGLGTDAPLVQYDGNHIGSNIIFLHTNHLGTVIAVDAITYMFINTYDHLY